MSKSRNAEDRDSDYLALVEALTKDLLPRNKAHMAVAILLDHPALERVINDRKGRH